MAPGVVTEWYRAPEVFLSPQAAKVAHYSTAIDTWSFGCIFYELLGTQPMARGRGAAEVCSCWLSVIGSPPSGVRSPLYLQGEQVQALLIEALRIPACRPPLPCHGAWPLVRRALQWDCSLRPSMADLATAISDYGFAPGAASVDGLPPGSSGGGFPPGAASVDGLGGGVPPGGASVDGLPPVAGATAEEQSSEAGPVPEVGTACQCTGNCGSLACKKGQNLRARGRPWTPCVIPPCEELVCVGGASVRPNSVAASAGRLSLLRTFVAPVLGGGAQSAGPQNKLC